MKRRIKNNLKVILVSMLSIAMILPVFQSMPLKANAATTETTTGPATLKGSTLTLDGSLKTNVIAEVQKATLGKKELTFSDFGMADGTPADAKTTYTCNAGYTSWDGLTLTGYVTFGGLEKKLYVGTGVNANAYAESIWLYHEKTADSNCLTMTSFLYTPDRTRIRTKDDNGNETGTLTITAEGVDFTKSEVKLSLSFGYTAAGVDMKVSINDTYCKTITFYDKNGKKASTSLGMGINSETKVRTAQEYEEVTFSDFGMADGTPADVKTTYTCNAGYTSWDGLTLTGYVTFGGLEKKLYIGTGVNANVYAESIWLYHEKTADSNCLTMTSFLYTPDRTRIRTKDDNGNETGTLTITAEGVDFTKGEVKLSLSFDYTAAGVDMKVSINDTYCKTITFYDKNGKKASASLGMGINSETKVRTAQEYEEITFANFGMPAVHESSNMRYDCNKKYTSWDGLTLTGYVKFGGADRRILIGSGVHENNYNSIWLEQDTTDTKVTNKLKLTCELRTPHNDKVRMKDDGYNAYIMIEDDEVNFKTDEVKLGLSFDYTDTGVNMKVSINDSDCKTVILENVENKTGEKASSALGMGIVNMAEYVKSTPYMSFEFENGNTNVVPLSQAVRTPAYGPLHYAFSYEMAAKEMTDSVKAQFHNGNQVSEEKTYTIQDYANTIIENKDGVYSESAISLAKALLDYGSAAQKYRNYKTDSLANPDFVVSNEVTAETLKPYAKSKQSHDEIATLTSTSLILESETTLKMFFTFAEGVSRDDFIFTDENGNSLETIVSGNRYCVVFENIKANELGKDCIVTITHKDNESLTQTYSYSVLSYCYVALTYYKDNEAKEALKTLAKTMYLYSQKADYYARGSME